MWEEIISFSSLTSIYNNMFLSWINFINDNYGLNFFLLVSTIKSSSCSSPKRELIGRTQAHNPLKELEAPLDEEAVDKK